MSTLPGVGVFGTNKTARWLISKLQDQGFSVEAIWSNIFTDAESTASSLNIPFYTTRVDDVLLRKNVGFIIICTPPALHSQIAVKALGIGKHVLCNIPGGLNQSECLRMVQAGQYYPSLMAVLSYSLRFHPGVVTMREMISEGWVGESINLVDIRLTCGSLLDTEYSWMCDSGMGGGVLARLGSHLLDLLTFLQLGRVTRVHANLQTLTRTTDNIKGRNIAKYKGRPNEVIILQESDSSQQRIMQLFRCISLEDVALQFLSTQSSQDSHKKLLCRAQLVTSHSPGTH